MSRRAEDLIAFVAAHPSAQVHDSLPCGATGILLPGYPLPAGWSKPHTDLVWLIPRDYPVHPLDCFWIDQDALSTSSQPRANTQVQACPLKTGIQRRWVSWHMRPWDPVRHDISIWLTSMGQSIQLATGRVY